MSSEQIWYDNLGGFINAYNYFVILPASDMTFEEKINALLRLFIYIGLVFTLVFANLKYMFFGIIAAVVSVLIVEFDKRRKKKVEQFLATKDLAVVNDTLCVRSTVDNPFMNPSIADITYNPTRPPACDISDQGVQELVENNFNKRLFKDVGDLYSKMASQREFYTVASTTIPNDQMQFAEWLYGSGMTCKEGNGLMCALNTEVNYPHLRAGSTVKK